MTKSPRPAAFRGPRNLVLCCDGTSNEPGPAATNVVRLFRALDKDDTQLVYYDPGIGTTGILNLWKRRTDRAKALLAQATGYGLDAHVTDAYRFLCERYLPGDRISIFGFSRGAYTARVVAGLVYLVGLLRAEQTNIAEFALKAYKQSADEDELAVGWRFARSLETRRVPIHFLGLWDTVGSMIAPLKDRVGLGLTHLPYTRTNPSVAIVRHAMAIDERRRMFRLNGWRAGPYAPDPFASSTAAQDALEVWFAGGHGDVGGGHPELESGLAKHSLLWMAGEAHSAGLRFDTATLNRICHGQRRANGELVHCPADAMGPIHQQPAGGWWIPEWIPKRARMKEWPERRDLLGYYLPAGEPRAVPDDAVIHRSVQVRCDAGDYTPTNLPPHGKLRVVDTQVLSGKMS
ncbi:DUF2235 domain-containing protein [Sphingomonas suaedae]|uniref:DUF2235 domain-containing protein n=1 Tax=Sphingomonas suaedae TaxID=2599297 RepID=A0A518RHQ5_9SPHN|nr:DUF2235 domain-containing protein [Sphingomonas suaedae]QDX26998.1 DUF2235 domain-containing protein [Sphingomonas suaedae]